MGLPNAAANTHANQWFERTLDDSAIRRIILPEGFLAVDVILNLIANISDGLHVWPNVIRAHAMAELPFMATEVILMECKLIFFILSVIFMLCFEESDIVCMCSATSMVYVQTGVKAGGDRQELHEAIRVHSMDAGAVVKGEGKPNDLMERIAKDPLFAAVHSKLDSMIDPILFVGRAPQQVDEFMEEEVKPLLVKHKSLLAVDSVDGVNV